ncbi:RNA polymerase II transcriptional coactivator [Adelges cooleyi]|uniref:RNA polymerase II transcriptional coactivator n=1 Tax=Adelges cooleyi TaxID=133065 RepID=UPI002180869B|nr:RNA polymerase II transcriptional coactivator [Adelges cooleyi]XP_050441755.1 RNA polymerase II transcriptional coactivator [Adelges cooleyi]
MAPKKTKREVSDDSSSDSGPDDRNPPPKKSKPADKAPAKKSAPKKDEEPSWSLDKNRTVKVREFRGRYMVDIREYYEKNGELLPGKKGISLSINQWNKLREHIDDIQSTLTELDA